MYKSILALWHSARSIEMKLLSITSHVRNKRDVGILAWFWILNRRSIWAFVILSFCQLNGICAYFETDVMSHVSFKTARHHYFFGNVEWIIRTIKYASCLSNIGAQSSGLLHVCYTYTVHCTSYNTRISKTFYESR